jgi:uncharacterized protein involved in outer membrane biogenesis
VVVEGLRVPAPDWAEAEHLVAAERLAVTARPWRWRSEPWRLTRIVVTAPDVHLERDADRGASWRTGDGGGGKPSASTLPYVGELVLRGGSVTYRDSASRRALVLRSLDLAVGRTREDAPVLRARGRLEDELFRLRADTRWLDGGGLHVDAAADVGRTTARVEGELKRPWLTPPLGADVRLEAPSLAALPAVVAAELPETGALDLEGHLTRTAQAWRLDDFALALGENRWSGGLVYAPGAPRGKITATLEADPLALGALMEGGGDGRGDLPARLAARLGVVDAEVDLTIAAFEGLPLPVERVETRIVLDERVLRLPSLEVGVAGGRITGEAEFKAEDGAPAIAADLAFEGGRLAPWLAGTPLEGKIAGRFGGAVDVAAHGADWRTMLDNATGEVDATLVDGTVSRAAVELFGMDVTDVLLLPLADEDMTIRCGLVRAPLEDGALKLRRAALDTPSSLLVARGSIDLVERALDLRLEARAKDFGLLDGAAPVLVRGPLTDPEVAVGDLEALPTLELGDAPALRCERLGG